MRGPGRRALLLGAPLLIAAAPVTQSRIVPAARPLSRMELPWWRTRHLAILERIQQVRVDLVLLGDSITQDLERRGPLPQQDFGAVWNQFHAPRHAINLGFKGDTTAHILWRLRNGEVAGIRPKVVQLLAGANNFGRVRWPAGDTLLGIEAVIEELRRRLPEAKIIILSVPPSRRSAWVDAQTAELNRYLVSRFRSATTIRCVDVTAAFLKNNMLDPDAFYDGALQPPEPLLHPAAATWHRMASMVEPTLAAWMDSQRR